ncbi:hypothetical protein AAMO2058_000195100 [Amorphochlora amoebiformis]
MATAKLQDTLQMFFKAGMTVSELENDLLFKAIAQIVREKKRALHKNSIRTTRYRGAMTKVWRKPSASISRSHRPITVKKISVPNRYKHAAG